MFLSLLNISVFSSCLDCCVWGGLSVCWKFVVPLYCDGSSLWVWLDERLVKVSWLGKLALVFWWVELDLFSLECSELSSSEFWGVYGWLSSSSSSMGLVWLLATCILMLGVMFLHCWRISLVCMSCSETCWLLGRAWFHCRYGGFWMRSCWWMFHGVRSFLVFSGFGFKPLASGFQLFLQ